MGWIPNQINFLNESGPPDKLSGHQEGQGGRPRRLPVNPGQSLFWVPREVESCNPLEGFTH